MNGETKYGPSICAMDYYSALKEGNSEPARIQVNTEDITPSEKGLPQTPQDSTCTGYLLEFRDGEEK